MLPTDDRAIDVTALRKAVKEVAKQVGSEDQYDALEAQLLEQFGAKKIEEVKQVEAEPPVEEKSDSKKSKDDSKKSETKEAKQ